MKLAEALIERKTLQTRLEELKQRLMRNAKVQEGDAPAEDPQALLAEIDRSAERLTSLIQAINHTNAISEISAGKTLTDAIAERDVLRIRHGIYVNLAASATVTHQRMTASEVKFVSAYPVAEAQQQADALAKQYRELDAALQAANWQIDLVE